MFNFNQYKLRFKNIDYSKQELKIGVYYRDVLPCTMNKAIGRMRTFMRPMICTSAYNNLLTLDTRLQHRITVVPQLYSLTKINTVILRTVAHTLYCKEVHNDLKRGK